MLSRHDPAHPLLWQAERDVLDQALEYRRLRAALLQVARGPLRLCEPQRLTPMAFPLWAERIRGGVHADDWKSRVERMAARLEKAAGR